MMLPLPVRPKPKNHYQDRPQLVQQCKAVHVGHKCSLPKGHYGRHWDFKAYRWPSDNSIKQSDLTERKPPQAVKPCPEQDGGFYCCETRGHPGPHYYQHHTSTGKLTYVWGRGMNMNTWRGL